MAKIRKTASIERGIEEVVKILNEEEVQEARIIANKKQVQIWFESNYTRERY